MTPSSTIGSNIVHSSPYKVDSFSNAVKPEDSGYSNPLEILETYKATALEELMKKHNSENHQKRVPNSGPVHATANARMSFEGSPAYASPGYQANYAADNAVNFSAKGNPPAQGPHFPEIKGLNSFDETPCQQQYEEYSGHTRDESPAAEQNLKQARMNTTKPPKQSKNIKKPTAADDETKQEYQLAKEKLKKDQERLKQSTNKMRSSQGMNEDRASAKQSRAKSKVNVEPPKNRHTYLTR